MDRKDLAKKLREALFDHIEAERREALQDAAIDKLFEGVLAEYELRLPVARPNLGAADRAYNRF